MIAIPGNWKRSIHLSLANVKLYRVAIAYQGGLFEADSLCSSQQ